MSHSPDPAADLNVDVTAAVADHRLDFLARRTSAIRFTEPGPDADTLKAIVAAATAVPDHARLKPYRFVVVAGEARDHFGTALALAAVSKDPSSAPFADKVKNKAFFAPMLIAVISSPRPSASVPVWEQEATAACAGFGLVLAAEALGYGAVWKSAPAHDGTVLTSLLERKETEKLLGWVNIGTRADKPLTRPKVDVEALITVL